VVAVVVVDEEAVDATDGEMIAIWTVSEDQEGRDGEEEEDREGHHEEAMAVGTDEAAEGMVDPEGLAVMLPEGVEVEEVDGLDPRWVGVMEEVRDDEEVEEVMADHVDPAVVTDRKTDEEAEDMVVTNFVRFGPVQMEHVRTSKAIPHCTLKLESNPNVNPMPIRSVSLSLSVCMLYTEYMGYTIH